MNNLKCFILATLYDHLGNPVRKYKPRPAHSFLAQFIEFLFIQMSQTGTYLTRVNGAELTNNPTILNFRVNADASVLTWGLLIGSGTDPVTIDDYALQTPITADLTVTAHTFLLSYPTTNARRLSISRTFTNGSGSTMSIEEVALYTFLTPSYYICQDRTLYSVGIPAASSLTLTYRIDVKV